MTTTPNREPTLADVLDKLEEISTDVENLSTEVEKLSTEVENLSTEVENLSTEVENLSTDVKKFDERFTNYQQATQWVVQLAFTLIASATITVIITAVLNK
jgi:outer membrane murein-binding lipoprotein Lpp